MKKLLIILAVLAVLVVIASTDRLPVKRWLIGGAETLAMRHADKLPLDYFGRRLFDKHCATCHDNPQMKAPTREALGKLSKESIMVAMAFGKMRPMSAHLSKNERGLIAHYLDAGGADLYDWLETRQCAGNIDASGEVLAGGWGVDTSNTRFVPAGRSGITTSNVGSLELGWSIALPKVADVRSLPVIIGDVLYFGDKAGMLYAIDRKSGCIHASTRFIAGIRSAITVSEPGDGTRLLVFADSLANVYAVDPQTLTTRWQTRVAISQYSMVTGSITAHDGKLFVPVSSYEVAAAGNPDHECCTSHGAVVALEAASGSALWQWESTPAAEPQGVNREGRQMWGPSGAAVWSTPTIDVTRNLLYVGTAENLSHPATETSDAVIALDLDTGEQRWVFQALAGDVWNASCLSGGANCPDDEGPDFDIGASVILATLSSGKEVLLVGQKSGEVFALDPDTEGAVLWQNRVGSGSTNGGIHWGMALAGDSLIVPMADPERDIEGYVPQPGVYALDARDGNLNWSVPATRRCDFDYSKKPLVGLEVTRLGDTQTLEEQYACSFYYGNSAAALATRGVAFSARLDGVIQAYDIGDGAVLWEQETALAFDAGNGIEGHGGAIDVGGQVIAGGWLYVLSGYSMFGQLPGNMLLAYRVAEATNP